MPSKLMVALAASAMAVVFASSCTNRGTASDRPIESKAESSPPNILLIISDDHAWGDYGFMGHEVVRTPSLDQLAREGVTFGHGYVPTSLCRPSLATIATGYYASQHGITGNDPSRLVEGGRDSDLYRELRGQIIEKIDEVQTLPELLRKRGYVSLQTGKWWEGSYQRGGFDEGMTRGFPELGGRHGDDGLSIGRDGLEVITQFIDKADAEGRPFFVWYAPFMPHTPHTPPDRLLANYQDKDLTESIAKYYAMIEWFDETNGQLFDHLDKQGLRENTMVVYVADNGWITNPEEVNRFLPRSKQSPDEGGVRTPIIFSLPGELAPQRRPELASSIDIVPTLLGAAGLEVPDDLPGINMFPHLQLGTPIEREAIFGEGFAHDMADIIDPEASLLYRWVIEGNWKLILSYDGRNDSYQEYHADLRGGPRLYNLSVDENEATNLASKHPEIVSALSARLAEWYPVHNRQILQD